MEYTVINTFQDAAMIDIVGLSTEIKPVILYEKYLMSSGSKFVESDTGNKYMYDQDGRKWYLLQD